MLEFKRLRNVLGQKLALMGNYNFSMRCFGHLLSSCKIAFLNLPHSICEC